MKQLIFSCMLFCVLQTATAQHQLTKIDSLFTDSQVEKFMYALDSNFKIKTIQEGGNYRFDSSICKRIADSLQINKAFYKSDIDNNGFTDLLVIGETYTFKIFVVFNYGNDSVMMKTLTNRMVQDCTFPVIVNNSVIRYYYLNTDYTTPKPTFNLVYKDLVYKFGDFVELNNHPSNDSIEKIEYEVSGCLGSCPSFSLVIKKNRLSFLDADYYNFKDWQRETGEMKGRYRTIVDDSTFETINNLLNYIDFSTLEERYYVDWTDDQIGSVKITYNNGKEKSIMDYGLIGTYGLARFHQLIFDLRFNQQWKKQ
ncbi:DUF6438 domain-containing protein [Ferruginibacter sp.]